MTHDLTRAMQKRAFGRLPREGKVRLRVSSGVGSRLGGLEKAQDQESWFPAQFLVILGIPFAHCLGWHRLNDFSDEESGIGRGRAQSRQRFTPKTHRLVSRWHTPDVGFQGGLEVGAAFAQPVHHRMLRRYHRRPAGPQDTAELGECGRTVAGIVNGERADDEVKGIIGVGQRLPERRLVNPHQARRLLPAKLTMTGLASKAVTLAPRSSSSRR